MFSRIRIPFSVLLVLTSALNASAHSDVHQQIVVADDADWATKHMAEEHHFSSFDATTFFTLHDYDSTGQWSRDDIQRTFGLDDPSTSHLLPAEKAAVIDTVLKLFDVNGDGLVQQDEFVSKWNAGERLPDFGFGPGHHGDDEYEYEIHHWEQYHSGSDVHEEDLTHPEDIEHFAKHDAAEQRREEWEAEEGQGIVEKNIPPKFRVN